MALALLLLLSVMVLTDLKLNQDRRRKVLKALGLSLLLTVVCSVVFMDTAARTSRPAMTFRMGVEEQQVVIDLLDRLERTSPQLKPQLSTLRANVDQLPLSAEFFDSDTSTQEALLLSAVQTATHKAEASELAGR